MPWIYIQVLPKLEFSWPCSFKAETSTPKIVCYNQRLDCISGNKQHFYSTKTSDFRYVYVPFLVFLWDNSFSDRNLWL